GLVSRHTAAAVAGLQGACMAACTKHFPGHGRTGTDTHEAIATIEGSLAELRLVDLPPFEAAIRAGTLAIMPSHLRVPELTGDLPATVSAAAITGLLRGELGFTGVIVSDALEMRATRDMFGIPGAAVLAVAAGTAVGPAVGLVAARRAVRVSGPHRTLNHPVIIEVEPRENIAAGRFGWGLAPWAPTGSVHRVSAAGRLLNGAGLDLADAARS